MGTRNAYAETVRVIKAYRPRLLVNIGIAGALDPQLRIGDVVIAEEVDNYDNRAKMTGDAAGSSRLNLSAGAHFSSPDPYSRDLRLTANRFPLLVQHWATQAGRRLREGIEGHAELRKNDIVARAPKVYAGPIASGETVVSSAEFKKQLRERNRAFLAVDMESAGVMDAGGQNGDLPVLVVKAISDSADSSKGELDARHKNALRAWAITNAFDYLHGFLTGVIDLRDEASQGARSTDLSTELRSVSVGHMKKRHMAIDPGAEIPKFDRFFSSFWAEPGPSRTVRFDEIAKSILASKHPHPLRVEGMPGTGKTAFLTMLYYSLVRTAPPDRFVVYVNLKRHVSSSSAELRIKIKREEVQRTEVISVPVHDEVTLKALHEHGKYNDAATAILFETAVQQLVNAYEHLMGDLVRLHIQANPKAALKDRTITYQELLEYESLEEAQRKVIETQVIEFVRGNDTSGHLAYLKKELGIDLKSHFGLVNKFRELVLRRHAIVHAGGVATAEYLRRAKEISGLGGLPAEGATLEIDPDYIFASWDMVYAMGVITLHLAGQARSRASGDKESEDHVDHFLNNSALWAVQQNRLKCAELILSYAAKLHLAKDTCQRMVAINLAQTFKWQGRDKECIDELGKHDWDSSSSVFRLAVETLRDGPDIERLMSRAAADKEIT